MRFTRRAQGSSEFLNYRLNRLQKALINRRWLARSVVKALVKWSSLSEYVKEIKQGFSRYYNRRHDRRGFFWSERFKSVIVDNGETLINCLAYIDLNPIRAGLVSKPEEYRWSSIGYHVQTDNKHDFLSLDFGLAEFGVKGPGERLRYYRRFLYEKGKVKGVEKEREKGFEISGVDRFLHRTRYFTDSGIIGSQAFVDRIYREFKDYFSSRHEKKPKVIQGLEGVYSLKRLPSSETSQTFKSRYQPLHNDN